MRRLAAIAFAGQENNKPLNLTKCYRIYKFNICVETAVTLKFKAPLAVRLKNVDLEIYSLGTGEEVCHIGQSLSFY
jgi:hypothetical protein